MIGIGIEVVLIDFGVRYLVAKSLLKRRDEKEPRRDGWRRRARSASIADWPDACDGTSLGWATGELTSCANPRFVPTNWCWSLPRPLLSLQVLRVERWLPFLETADLWGKKNKKNVRKTFQQVGCVRMTRLKGFVRP